MIVHCYLRLFEGSLRKEVSSFDPNSRHLLLAPSFPNPCSVFSNRYTRPWNYVVGDGKSGFIGFGNLLVHNIPRKSILIRSDTLDRYPSFVAAQ